MNPRTRGIRENDRRACRRLHSLGTALALGASLWTGCGPGNAPEGFGEFHGDIIMGSTQRGAGALALEYDFAQEVAVSFSQCVGGSGEACDGGIVLYSGEAPGFAPLEADEPEESFFVLEEGTAVSVERTAGDAAASFFYGGVNLAEPGDSVLLGTAIEGLHQHGEWQLTLPGGTEPEGPYALGLKLTSSSPDYDESEEFMVMIVVEEHD